MKDLLYAKKEIVLRGDGADGIARKIRFAYYLTKSGADCAEQESVGVMESQGEFAQGFSLSRFGGTESEYSGQSGASFGIRITMRESGRTEGVSIGDITHDENVAMRIIKLLSDNLATPCSLRDILDDILGISE
jgi:hypothetical protein